MKKCVVCKRRKRMDGEKICKACWQWFKQNYCVHPEIDPLDEEDVQLLIRDYEDAH